MSDTLVAHEATFLKLVLQHAPLQDVFAYIGRMAEAQVPGMKCRISAHDERQPLQGSDEGSWYRPLQSSSGQAIGSIRLCPEKGASTKEPTYLLETLAQLAMLAYDHDRLPSEIMERSRLAALAVRISDIQSRTVSLQHMLQLCTEALVQDLEMAFARIWLFNEAEQMLALAASAGLSTNLHGRYSRVPVATSLKIGRMVRERQPMLTNRILEENWIREPDWAKREGLVAYGGYPLIAEDQVVGVMAMFAKHVLSEYTLQALATIASGLAQAIIKTKAENEKLERVKELEAFHHMASLLEKNEAVPQTLQQMVTLLPAAWRYPAIAQARIRFMGQEYTTPHFRPTPWYQVADFRLAHGWSGRLEVVYLEDRSAENEGPFVLEERWLINSLAELLQNYLERKQAEQELRKSRDLLRRMNATLEDQVADRTRQLLEKQEQLRSLAIDLSRTEEHARQQLATDLHDNLAQMLALARMKLHDAEPALRASRAFQEVNGLLGESLAYTRAVMADLRPPLLSDAHDVQRAISWVVDRVQRRGLSVIIDSETEPILLDKEVLTVTYQAIHELLFNVLKHAQTQEARLTLQSHHESLEVVVTDHGRGFDVRHLSTATKEGGFGLLNVRERVELLGGRLEISSRIGEGTCSKVMIPLHGDTTMTDSLKPLCHNDLERGGVVEEPTEAAGFITRIVLVDDHALMRDGLRRLLEEQSGLCVVAEASDGQMAIELAQKLRPDIMVMDVNMPKMNGLEATRLITAEFPEIGIIGLSMQDDAKTALSMQKAGAIGFVSKGDAAERLVQMIGAARSAKI